MPDWKPLSHRYALVILAALALIPCAQAAPNQPPTVTLTAPTEGSVYQINDSVTLSAQAEEGGLKLVEAAKRLSMPKGSLKNWVDASRQGKLGEVGKHQKPLTDLELELARTKRELAEAKMERDFLKKCAAYFAKESR